MSDQPKPTTGEATEKSHAVNQVRGMHEQIQQALKDARQTPEYAEKKSSEPATGEWTIRTIDEWVRLNPSTWRGVLAFEHNAELAAEREKWEKAEQAANHNADISDSIVRASQQVEQQLRSQLAARNTQIELLVDQNASYRTQLAAAQAKEGEA